MRRGGYFLLSLSSMLSRTAVAPGADKYATVSVSAKTVGSRDIGPDFQGTRANFPRKKERKKENYFAPFPLSPREEEVCFGWYRDRRRRRGKMWGRRRKRKSPNLLLVIWDSALCVLLLSPLFSVQEGERGGDGKGRESGACLLIQVALSLSLSSLSLSLCSWCEREKALFFSSSFEGGGIPRRRRTRDRNGRLGLEKREGDGAKRRRVGSRECTKYPFPLSSLDSRHAAILPTVAAAPLFCPFPRNYSNVPIPRHTTRPLTPVYCTAY